MSDTTRIEQVIPITGLNNRHEWLSSQSLTFSPADVTINSELLNNIAGTTTASVPDYLQMYMSRPISDRIDSAIMNGDWSIASTTSNTYPYRGVRREQDLEPASSWLFDEETIRDAIDRSFGRLRPSQETRWNYDVELPEPPVEPEPIPQDDLLRVINLE